jgi:hypothetical protein
MRLTTLEWISKAEDDWHVAQMSYRARKHPSYDAAVFHAQQCAEKYLKARLEKAGIAFSYQFDLSQNFYPRAYHPFLHHDERQIKAAGEISKNSPSFFACALLIARLPLKTSEAMPREPKIGNRSACLMPRFSINVRSTL